MLEEFYLLGMIKNVVNYLILKGFIFYKKINYVSYKNVIKGDNSYAGISLLYQIIIFFIERCCLITATMCTYKLNNVR